LPHDELIVSPNTTSFNHEPRQNSEARRRLQYVGYLAAESRARIVTTFLLVRHCEVEANGRYLAGRTPGIHLSAAGELHARHLASRFVDVKLDAIYSSPLERARETAAALAACILGDIQFVDDLLEVDFGDWTGLTFEMLARDERWRRFNERRSMTRIPGGELAIETQARAVAFLERVAGHLPNGRVAVVTHGDVIRTAICFFLAVPLDMIHRFEIATGSVSVADISPDTTLVKCLNDTDFDPKNWFEPSGTSASVRG